MTRRALWAVSAAAALALAAALLLAGDDPRPVHSLAIEDLERAKAQWVPAAWRTPAGERAVFVRELRALQTGRLLVVAARSDAARQPGAALAALVVAEPLAVLRYHAASRDPLFADLLLPTQLTFVELAAETRLALLLSPEWLEAREVPLTELEPERAARLLALAEALAGWDWLRGGARALSNSAGRSALAFFAPALPGDWRDLFGVSVEGYLPVPLARYTAATPGFRESSYAHLAAFAAQVPRVDARSQALAAELAADLAPETARAFFERSRENAEAILAYLESSWVDCIVTQHGDDELRAQLAFHTLVPLELRALSVEIPVRLALAEKNAISALRLRGPNQRQGVRAAVQRDRLRFPVGIRIDPVPLGYDRFGSSRLEFSLRGLARSAELRERIRDGLRPQIVRTETGVALGPEHIRQLASIHDSRFGLDADETPEAFASALPTRIVRRGAGPAPRWIRDTATLRVAAGEYDIRDDLVLPAGADLVLDAGVTLRVAPRRSILVRGRLDVRGSAVAPVRVRGASDDEPWGVFAVQGSGLPESQRNSTVRHLELEGGSEDMLRGAYYSGQLSVYHADLSLSDSVLRNSHADDSLNVKYARLEIRRSEFDDSYADAVDLDWVEGTIDASLFEDMGAEGDGIDFSGSDVRVTNSVVSRAGDKCLSVGERSSVEVRGVLLRDCAIGVASKDESNARLREAVLIGNERDFAAYRKKPIFGGARIRASELLLIGGREPAQRDAESEIVVEDSAWVGAESGELGRPGNVALDMPAGGLDDLAAVSAFSAADYAELRSRIR